MNPENHELHVLRALILKAQAESLSEAEIVELNALIHADGGADEAAALIDQLCAFTDAGPLDSLLMSESPCVLPSDQGRDQGSDPESGQRGEQSTGRSTADRPLFPVARADSPASQPFIHPDSSTIWTNFSWPIALVVSNLLVASMVWFLVGYRPRVEPTPVVAPSAVSFQPAFKSPQLVSMTACVWNSVDKSAPTLGKPFQSGEVLNLVEGIAELKVGEETAGEALIRIEGPASAVVRADGQLGFRRGAMTVKTLGFGNGKVILQTQIGEVLIDGQSSVGLVASDSDNEVHLFSGRALVRPSQLVIPSTEVVLEEGEAVRYLSKPGGEHEVVMFEASLSRFASARSSGFDPLEIDGAYVQSVLDSKPSIYWRFEETEGEFPQYVKNQGSHPGLNAQIVGEPGWRQYGQNRVAELGQSSTATAFRTLETWPPQPLNEYTVEMWIKPQLYHHGEVLCLHDVEPIEDGRYQHAMMFETVAQHYFTDRLSGSPSNRFRFVHRALGATQPINATSLFSGNEYQARLWQHVVAQKNGDRQMLLVDGQLVSERSNSVSLAAQVQILVGQVYPDSNYRSFVGQIDEIAIYDRFLSINELRTHIKAAGRTIGPKVEVAVSSDVSSDVAE